MSLAANFGAIGTHLAAATCVVTVGDWQVGCVTHHAEGRHVARGLTLAQAHAWVDEAAGDAQRAAIELAASDELRALAAVIDQAITDAASYSPLVLAKAVLAAGYRR